MAILIYLCIYICIHIYSGNTCDKCFFIGQGHGPGPGLGRGTAAAAVVRGSDPWTSGKVGFFISGSNYLSFYKEKFFQAWVLFQCFV